MKAMVMPRSKVWIADCIINYSVVMIGQEMDDWNIFLKDRGDIVLYSSIHFYHFWCSNSFTGKESDFFMFALAITKLNLISFRSTKNA